MLNPEKRACWQALQRQAITLTPQEKVQGGDMPGDTVRITAPVCRRVEKLLPHLAAKLEEKYGEYIPAKLVIAISGGSGSGKTSGAVALREALAQVKAARLAASAVSAQCYSAGQAFADQTSADGFADGIAEDIRTLGALPGTVTLLQIDPNGYTVQRLLYQENGMYAIYDADGGYRVFRAEDRLQYGAGVGHAAA